MRNLNIASLCQVKESLSEKALASFLEFNGIGIKNAEIDDFSVLVECLLGAGLSIEWLGEFYVGYKIPQIGKEFDLLKFSRDAIINIEVKRESAPEKICVQLSRNRYYLESTGRKIESFAFVSSEKRFYYHNSGGDLEEVGVEVLIKGITSLTNLELCEIDSLFNPSEFLVSPFNSTEKFLESNYFLTHQQEEIKLTMLQRIGAGSGPAYFSLSGGPGTGKTLLIYDVARSAMLMGLKVLVIHCGSLNPGHEELRQVGFSIIPAKNIPQTNIVDYDLVILDECQRIYPEQLEKIVNAVQEKGGFCLLSHDGRQTLAAFEARRDVVSKILAIPNVKKYLLSDKIRSNAELANFIKMLQSRSRKLPIGGHNNIFINYFKDIRSADVYLSSLGDSRWELLRFTPSQYVREYHQTYFRARGQTSHQVIGQEFDCVAVVIDNLFTYDEEGYLIYRGASYYDPARMLFQNLTRAKRQLNIIIVNNEEILRRCAEILCAKIP